jgi:hypothetical protein
LIAISAQLNDTYEGILSTRRFYIYYGTPLLRIVTSSFEFPEQDPSKILWYVLFAFTVIVRVLIYVVTLLGLHLTLTLQTTSSGTYLVKGLSDPFVSRYRTDGNADR